MTKPSHTEIMKEKKRSQKVAQVNVCHHFEHHPVFIKCQHQRCLHYCLGQGPGAMLTLENALYCLSLGYLSNSRSEKRKLIVERYVNCSDTPEKVCCHSMSLYHIALYCMQSIWFVAFRLSILAALPRTMDRSIAKLNEDTKVYSKVC